MWLDETVYVTGGARQFGRGPQGGAGSAGIAAARPAGSGGGGARALISKAPAAGLAAS